jgi:hypothetical protein
MFTIINSTDDSNLKQTEEEGSSSLAETKDGGVPCELIQTGTLNYYCIVNLTNQTKKILHLSSLTMNTAQSDPANNEILNDNNGEINVKNIQNKSNDNSYTVSSSSPSICVNCDFCLNENSANIFLTRVDFDKEEPDDKKKLFRQYISLPIKTGFKNFEEFNKAKVDFIYGVSTDGVKATFDNCVINKHEGEDKFFDCNLAKNKQFKGEGGKDDDHAREFIIYFNVTDDFTIATKYELHLVKGEFLSLSFTLLFLFLGILF